MGCTIYREWTNNGGLKINFRITEGYLTIFNSFVINDDEIKWKFINYLYSEFPFLYKYRSKKSFFREWKSHNILFRKNVLPKNTRDTDIEFKQKLIFKMGYWFIATFLKE